FARGDRRCGKLLLEAYRQGCRLDGWSEHFDPEKWERAAELSGTDIDFYTTRERSYEEVLPWDIIDSSVSGEYLQKEAEKAKRAETTRDCRRGCTGCGINKRTVCRMGGIYE
ncbi:MAG: B12-binding domain-containing radical SAM protein, partial [Anaerovoracaceae bacterium]